MARLIVARRQVLGWSQERLAERAMISARTVRNLERAVSRPRWHTVRLVAGALGVDEREWIGLLNGDNSPAAERYLRMPAALEGFVGREPELATLDFCGREAAGARGAMNVAIVGTAGVGKTALAVQAAHRLAHRYPDGQFYVNMRGFDPGGPATTPAEAITSLLAQLGRPVGATTDMADLTQSYRDTLLGKRVLVVLDDVRDAEQAWPLLTDRAASLTVVTSRRMLPWAADRGRVRMLRLDLLSRDDARALVTHRIGEKRVSAEPAALDDIVRRCGRLPLALAIIAARATTRPHFTLAEIADDMRAYRRPLDAFAGGEPKSDVRTVISWSYDALSPGAASALRALGHDTSASVSINEMAGMLRVDVAQARRVLDELVCAQLIRPLGNGCYALDGLNHAFATELAASTP